MCDFTRKQVGTIAYAAAAVMLLVVLVVYASRHGSKTGISDPMPAPHGYERGYAHGVNTALDSVMLLDLEQKLQGTNRNWGAMADVVRGRLGVKKEGL